VSFAGKFLTSGSRSLLACPSPEKTALSVGFWHCRSIRRAWTAENSGHSQRKQLNERFRSRWAAADFFCLPVFNITKPVLTGRDIYQFIVNQRLLCSKNDNEVVFLNIN